MNKAIRLIVAILVLGLLSSASLPQAQRQRNRQSKDQSAPLPDLVRRDAHLVMISIDGLIPEYYTEPAKVGLKVPNLTMMKLGGAFADGVEGIYPSVTYPAHTTLITGARPAVHGIYQNRIFESPTEPKTGEWFWFSKDLKCETLWSAARAAELSTGSVGWPVTVGAAIDYNVPEIFDPKDPKSPARALANSTPGLIAKALAETPSGDSSTDARRTAISEYIITTYKPNLMLVHLIALDDAHHKYGPRSPEALATAETMDGYIGRIIAAVRNAGILDKTTFFLVSDHGFMSVDKRFEPGVILAKEKLITVDGSGKATAWKAAVWNNSGSCSVILHDPDDKETAAKVIAVFRKLAEKPGGPIYRMLTRTELDKLGAVPGAVLMLDAAPGFSIGDEITGPEIHEGPRDYRGTHGQLPSRSEMRSSLIIYGELARVGTRLGLAQMVDIGPTAGVVLGVALPGAQGAAIRSLLKADAAIPLLPKEKKKS